MQRAVPKTHDKAMENLDQKLEAKQEAIKKAEKELKHAKKVAVIIIQNKANTKNVLIPFHCNKKTFIFTSGG